MGPKAQPSKKALDKQKQKIVEDKTFGLKNKKGAKQQKFIQQVQTNVSKQGKSAKELARLQEEKERKKNQKEARTDELKTLFKPVIEQRAVPKGADPKSIVCAFFKQGICAKGDKCKFSHDLTKERKAEKINIYEDVRDDENDVMADWDETKLNEVVNKRHGELNKKNATSIICKYFLEAVENQTYGWFWECPMGNDKCIYRHCLPQGYVLKRDRKALETAKEEISLEDLIERERAALGANLTKVTLSTFLQWKKKNLEDRKKAAKTEEQRKRTDFRQGRTNGLTGRDMFTYDPSIIIQDEASEEMGEDVDYKHREIEEGEEEYSGFIHEINVDEYYKELENNGTEGMCSANPPSDVAIDESLFTDADIDQIDEELKKMNFEGVDNGGL